MLIIFVIVQRTWDCRIDSTDIKVATLRFISCQVSLLTGKAEVVFDKTKTNPQKIADHINILPFTAEILSEALLCRFIIFQNHEEDILNFLKRVNGVQSAKIDLDQKTVHFFSTHQIKSDEITSFGSNRSVLSTLFFVVLLEEKAKFWPKLKNNY